MRVCLCVCGKKISSYYLLVRLFNDCIWRKTVAPCSASLLNSHRSPKTKQKKTKNIIFRNRPSPNYELIFVQITNQTNRKSFRIVIEIDKFAFGIYYMRVVVCIVLCYF